MGRFVAALLFAVAVAGTGPARAGAGGAYLVHFDSRIRSEGTNIFIQTRVGADSLVQSDDSDPFNFRGVGRLRYLELSGIPGAIDTDGVLDVTGMRFDTNDGTIELDFFPGNPKPNEWFVFPGTPPTQFFHWFGVFGGFHLDELTTGTGYRITEFEYPTTGEVYARAQYERMRTDGEPPDAVTHTETTLIELIPILDPPSIDRINVDSGGQSAKDPEAGKNVELTADLTVPTLFTVTRCTWTGNNFTGPGMGDPEDKCRWSYVPQEGPGPAAKTYGDKQLTLQVVYDYGTREEALEQIKTETYRVFFTKNDDDNGDGKPNWFDYWGEDGAVPGLDAIDVNYDTTLGSGTFGFYSPSRDTVFFGPAAAESDGSITVPENDNCVGGSFPGGAGIDIAAITLAHEKKHQTISKISGTDTDNDGLPDSAEDGTSPNNPDSCNLASIISPDYATYGDDEFNARLAEIGVEGVGENDWAVPGRQAMLSKSLPGDTTMRTGRFMGPPAPQPGSAVPKGLGASLMGGFAAMGNDTDGDAAFDELLVSVDVNIVTPGRYGVLLHLADGDGNDVAWARTDAELGAGMSTLTVRFDGPTLWDAGSAMAYGVSRARLLAQVGKHEVLQDEVADPLVTGLVADDFDPPAARLAGNLSEQTPDEGGDGLFDSLEISVDVAVNDAGQYELSGVLQGTQLSLAAATTVVLTPGVNPVTLAFRGEGLFYHREDGPWTLSRVTLADAGDGTEFDLLLDGFTTAAYTHTAFQHSGVIIDHTSYADRAGPTDDQGKFTSLELTLLISSEQPGPHRVLADLTDATGRVIASATTLVGLAGVAGFAEVTDPAVLLAFPGEAISAAGIDGPYQVSGVTVLSDGGELVDQSLAPYATASYAASDFVAGPAPSDDLVFMDGFEN